MTSNMVLLGSRVCPESMYYEHKEFCLKIYRKFTNDQIHRMLYSGKLPSNFNETVLHNIKLYFQQYVPKYITSFHNTPVGGCQPFIFSIGVDDCNEVTGIPFLGNLCDHRACVSEWIQDVLSTRINHTTCIDIFLDIQECETDVQLLSLDQDFHMRMEMHHRQMRHYNIIHKKYRKKHRRWVKDIMKYKGRLQYFFTNAAFREEFSEYLKTIHMYDKFKHHIQPGYVVNMHAIDEDKTNPESFIFWLIYYKDLKVQELMKQKPTPPASEKRSNLEYSTIVTLRSLRERWLNSNQKLKYFIIQLKCNKQTHDCSQEMWYITKKNEWKSVKRSVTNGSPFTY